MNESDYTIVTLCGSSRFKDEFMREAKRLTLNEYIVLTPFLFEHSGDKLLDAQRDLLDDLHKGKIFISDYIYVINKGGYIGESTRSEIEYAESLNIPIVYMEDCNG